MSDCTSIDPLVTPYIDGELAPSERQIVDQHLRLCRSCHGRVAVEREVRELVAARRPALGADRPSAALRMACSQLAVKGPHPVSAARRAPQPARAGLPWRMRLAPLALAASLVGIVGGAFVYQATERSTRVMAAELTADHVKCFALNGVFGTHHEANLVEQSMLTGFGWRMRAAAQQFEDVGLRLVGSRPCLYGEGRVAHIMFRHEGRPVSIFMLPKAVREEELIKVMGHQAAVWSVGGRTFVLIAREPRTEVERMASMVRSSLR